MEEIREGGGRDGGTGGGAERGGHEEGSLGVGHDECSGEVVAESGAVGGTEGGR